MRTHEKSSEELQAQVAAYIAEGHESHNARVTDKERSSLFEDIGQIAAGPVEDYASEYPTRVFDTSTSTYRTRMEPFTAPAKRYMDYLRREGAGHGPAVSDRVKYLQRYRDFQADVAPFLQRSNEEREYLGQGTHSTVYALERGGQQYVVKVPQGKEALPKKVDHVMQALSLGQGVARLEQLAAVSYKDGVVISERVPGKNCTQLSAETLAHVTEDQMRDVFPVFEHAAERGIGFDPKPDNYMYDPELGFGFIDYQKAPSDHPQDVDKMAQYFAVALLGIGTHFEHEVLWSTEDYGSERQGSIAARAALITYEKVCREMTQHNLTSTLQEIRRRVKSLDDFIANSANPEWVNARLNALRQTTRVAITDETDEIM